MLFGRKKKNPVKIPDKQVQEWKYAACGYCSTGCSIEIGLDAEGQPVASRGVADADVNRGKLCLKGIFEHELFTSTGRGTRPLVRDHFRDEWRPIAWGNALDRLHDQIRRVQANTNGVEALREEVEKWDPVTASKVCGIDEDSIRVVARTFAKVPAAMQIWTMGINQSTHGSDGVVGINNLALITGNIGRPGGTSLSITGQCNAMGTREWSSYSGRPNYRYLEIPEHREEIARFWNVDPEFFPKHRGMFQTDIYQAMEAGQIKGLWLIATNPMSSLPNTARIRRAMEKLEFCCVQDCYEDSESNQYAHLYLPAGTWAEKDGVMTNTERRVNRVKPVTAPPAEARPDLWIFNRAAERFNRDGKVKFPETAADIFLEMGELSRGRLCDISGMDHEFIEQNRGIQWPYTMEQRERGDTPPKGGKRIYTEEGSFSYPDGRAMLIPLPFIDNNEVPDDPFPFWLNTGRLIEHWHGRTKTGKIGNNNKFSPIPFIEINPDAAAELGVCRGDYVRLVSRRGDAIAMAQLSGRVPKNMVFLPFHFHDCANRLTLGLLDPHSRQPAYKQSAVRIERLADQVGAARLSREMRKC